MLLTIDRLKPCPAWKKARIPKGATQSHFPSWQCSITYGKTGSLTHYKHSAEKFNPLQLTHQTWLLLNITYSHQWITYLLSSALVHTKMWKYGSMDGSQQREKILLAWHSQFARKMGKCITGDVIQLKKARFIILSNLTCFLKEKIRISYLYTWYNEL